MSEASVDLREIAKFEALAKEWWNPSGPFKALHRINPVRLRYLRDAAHKRLGSGASGRPLSGVCTLDIGCGGGLVSVPLARMGAVVTGIDASAEAIGAAQSFAQQAGIDIAFRHATVEQLAAAGEHYDLVTALEIIEHVADVPLFLSAASAVLRPGGLMIVSTINRTAKARALAIVAAEKILQWSPEGAHEFDKLVTPDEIRSATPDISWDDPVGITYNPLGEGWSSSSDIDVNYMMAGVRKT